jgi:hypothetical protein
MVLVTVLRVIQLPTLNFIGFEESNLGSKTLSKRNKNK